MGILHKLTGLFHKPDTRVLPLGTGIDSAARFNLAVELDKSGKTAEAEAIYTDMFNSDKSQIGAAINLGDIWIRQRKYADAVLLLQAVVGLHPGYSAAWCNLSAALSITGDHEQALHAANEAVKADNGNAQAYYNRAECWWALLQHQLAIRDYETAVECDPRNEEISTKLSLARLAIQETVKQPFGDVKHEMKAHGAWIVDGFEVASTMQCPHSGCEGPGGIGGTHFVSLRGSGTKRDWCARCGALTCGSPYCDPQLGNCIPWRKTLDDIESAARHQIP